MLLRPAACVSKPRGFRGASFLDLRNRSPIEFQGLAPTVPMAVPSLRIFPGSSNPESSTVRAEDPTEPGMAGRYASALFELAKDENAIDRVRADLATFDRLLDESPELLRLVRSPVIRTEDQVKALSAVLDRAGIRGLAANFIKFVASQRRLFRVREMIASFQRLAARYRGEVSAQVTLAEAIGDQHLATLKETLKSATGGRDVDLRVKIDPGIIGGLVVQLGSRMIDTSLRTKLNAIKLAMKEAR
jgi:F-type H+-transporting ATPase subunit delta